MYNADRGNDRRDAWSVILSLFAVDTRIYGAYSGSDLAAVQSTVAGCGISVAEWMHSDRLQLNAN
jgi:hypothetical protein